MKNSKPTLVWIKEEGNKAPLVFDMLKTRGWNVELFGLDAKDLRHHRYFRFIRFAHTSLNVLKVIVFNRRVNMVVGTHYAGLLAALLGRFLLRKNTKVIVYLYFEEIGDSVFAFCKRKFQRYCLSKSTGAVLNSENLLIKLRQSMKNNPLKYFVLDDMVSENISGRILDVKESYIFVGGESYRDWDAVSSIINRVPSFINFVIVCPKKYKSKFLKYRNAKTYSEIPSAEFDEKLYGAIATLIVLRSGSLAGLTVLKKAQAHGVLVIAKENENLKTYIKHNQTGLIAFNNEEIAKYIADIWSKKLGYKEIVSRARFEIENEYKLAEDKSRKLSEFLISVASGN